MWGLSDHVQAECPGGGWWPRGRGLYQQDGSLQLHRDALRSGLPGSQGPTTPVLPLSLFFFFFFFLPYWGLNSGPTP
jgi:hypothetical protein